MITRFEHLNNLYAIKYDFEKPDYITFENLTTNTTKTVKVTENDDYTWKINKRSRTLSGINGAKGLFCFFSDSVRFHFMESYLYATLTFLGL